MSKRAKGLPRPDLHYEEEAWRKGHRIVVGLDEVGRGCLAGPVVAAAVVLEPGVVIEGVTDSKRLSAAAREALAPIIHKRAFGVGLGAASAEEIDRVNILQATWLAMGRALDALECTPDFLLVDGKLRYPSSTPQRTLIGGDARSLSIACASIVAKVARDRSMVEWAERFPGYGFERHKGYGTAAHRAAIRALGPCLLHRRGFRGVCPDDVSRHKQLTLLDSGRPPSGG